MSETTTLPVLLLRPGSRPALVADCVIALEEEVAEKAGIGLGIGIAAGSGAFVLAIGVITTIRQMQRPAKKSSCAVP